MTKERSVIDNATQPVPAGRRRGRRPERGIAIAMTGLLLVPLMVFAAFGIDLASWYARISELQRAADAAALAGAVWMPATETACAEATRSLIANGFDDENDDTIETDCRPGATSTAVRVTVTDLAPDRFFSSAFMRTSPTLTRFAEAEYNLPLPLGSPLNYFGGDSSTVVDPPPNYSYTVQWPAAHTTRVPVDTALDGSLACSITGNANLRGRWAGTNAGNNTWRPNEGHQGGDSVCGWTVARGPGGGSSTTPPPDYAIRPPTNMNCRVRSGATNLGYWRNTGGGEFRTSWSGGGAPTTNCSWPNVTTDFSVLAGHPLGMNPAKSTIPNVAPINRPCRVGYATSDGWYATAASNWTNTGTLPAAMNGGAAASGNRLCAWSAQWTDTTTFPEPLIPDGRDPGFWAVIYGPGQYAANGDAFSARCTTQFNCSTVQNAQYRANDDVRGEWYVVEIPDNVAGSVAIRVFDAAFNRDWGADYDEGGNPRFYTEYQLYTWHSSLDFANKTARPDCYWRLIDEAQYDQVWSTLCSVNVNGGERFLLNVRTTEIPGVTVSNGNNAYAVEVVLDGDRDANPGPSIYAYRDMVINNNNVCSSGTCTGTFYLAKVDPVYAGRTLVIEMYDAGDSTQAGRSVVYPMMPHPNVNVPRPVVPVPASDCTYTATPDPNPLLSNSDARIRSGIRTDVTSPSPPDSGDGECGVVATIGGTRQYNGLWLRIRVQIPEDYDCDRNENRPEERGNSCWWGIRYQFSGNASDTTTWQARIEGNPLQLTE